MFKHPDGAAKGSHARHERVQVIVKDGVVTNVDMKGDGPAALERELAADGVQVTDGKDGRRVVMIRRHALAADAERHAADAHRLAATRMAQVRSDMRADCAKQGITLAADADLAQLATCGRDIQKDVREAMATARKAINDAKWLSAEERARALKGLEQAQADIRREVVVKLEM